VDSGPILFTLLYHFTFTHSVYFLALLLSYYHSIRSILCLQQTGEIDNLIVSWEQSSWLFYMQVSRCCWGKTRRQAVVSGALVRSVTKLASITFRSLAFFLLVRLNLGFTTEERLATVLITPSSVHTRHQLPEIPSLESEAPEAIAR
jgi:hypothetical protein